MLTKQLQRFFSFNCKNLHKITKKSGLKIDMEQSNLLFGQDFTSHMAEVDYNDIGGWSDPIIKPLEPFQMHPGCSTIHYSLSCFEGSNFLTMI